MIEDATIYVDGKPFSTRLHEHGKEPAFQYQPSKDWLYTGYMEGKESTLTTLKNSGLSQLEFNQKGKSTVLTGIVWGDVVNMYDEHFILHLDWAGEKSSSGGTVYTLD